MKNLLKLIALAPLIACVSSDAQSVEAEFQGTNLNVIWSPTTDERATIILADRNIGVLPREQVFTTEFRAFFQQTTGCEVDQSKTIDFTQTGGRLFSVLVPKTC